MRFQKQNWTQNEIVFFPRELSHGNYVILEMNYCTNLVPRKDMRLLAHRSEPMQSIQIISELSNS